MYFQKGECQYCTWKEKVMVKTESIREEIIPAVYSNSTKEILIEEAILTAGYYQIKIDTIQVEIQSKQERIRHILPKCMMPRYEQYISEILCDGTAKYSTYTISPNYYPFYYQSDITPPIYKKIVHRSYIPDKNGQYYEKQAAIYETVTISQLVKETEIKKSPLPAQYKTITKTRCTGNCVK